jgi:urease accessory protein
VILTERARHAATTAIHASAGAEVTVDEVLVLGRAAEATGSLRSTLSVRIDGTPALHTSIDTSLPGWSGPAGVAGATVVGHRLRLGAEPSDGGTDAVAPAGAVLLRPAAGCRLAVATAAQVADARGALDALLG